MHGMDVCIDGMDGMGGMYACMHVCMHACMYRLSVCMYVCMHVCSERNVM